MIYACVEPLEGKTTRNHKMLQTVKAHIRYTQKLNCEALQLKTKKDAQTLVGARRESGKR